MLILFFTIVIGFSLDPIQIVQALDNKYASLLNAGDYHGIAHELFHKDALVIPPIPTEFIEQPDLGSWFQWVQSYWDDNITMTPEVVVMQEEFGHSVIHEIGRWTGVYNRYYQRWVNYDGAWLISLSAIAIGEPEPGIVNLPLRPFSTSNLDDEPSKLIFRLEKEFDELYNNGDFESVGALFNDDALLIPRSADRFFIKKDLTKYFEMAYNLAGLKHANTKPVIVVEESPMVIHEIGGIQVNNETQVLPYYVRWVRNSTVWDVNFYLSVFPIPHPHPPEIKQL